MLDPGRTRTPFGARVAAVLVLSCCAGASGVAWAQPADSAPGNPPSPTPAKSPPRAAAKDAEPGQRLAPVSITGSRPDDFQEQRNSTAAKIIIGREEIDKFGDSTPGDVLKRLPGVITQGRPGRAAPIR